MVIDQPEGRAKGGVERARRLTTARKSEIAQAAAAARWDESLPQAVCASNENKPLRLADVEVDAYVLEDGTRVLSQSAVLTLLGRSPRARGRRTDAPRMLQGAAFTPFLTPDLIEAGKPIAFRTTSGLRGNGYRAEFLVKVCEVYLKARDAGTLAPNQRQVARQADILMRAFATVGIIALVDEATGYQDLRSRNALAKILEDYIEKELQPWVQTFPNDFYKEMFRLRGLVFSSDSVKRPQYFGNLTNDIVYKRLAPGVLEELKRVTPRNERGRPKSRYFQHLTSNIGYPKLREHLGSVVTLMKLSSDWGDFQQKLNKIHPRFGATLPLFDDSAEGL